jgi:adenine-specific DNA-methyltransferase
MPTLDWIGKKAVVNHHREVSYHLLKCDKALSVGDPGSGNLLVQGDNLRALKALLPYYAGKVKFIYIDPPYNTGNEGWMYNDAVNSPEIRQWLRQAVGREGEDLSRHDKWLCMMYPRLALLREYLTKDGVIFISIDDNEAGNLRLVMDEIFGRANRVGTIVWKNATDNNPTRIVPEHEYVLCYARSLPGTLAVWKAQTLDVKQRVLDIADELIAKYSDADALQESYTKWFRENKIGLWPFQDYKFIDKQGVYTGMRSVHNPGKEGYRYDVLHPQTGKPCRQPMMGYRFPPETMQKLLKEDRILFGDDETKLIELKVYAQDYKAKLSSVFELDGRRGTNEIKAIFPESKRAFNFPKPMGLIEELLAFATSGEDIVLDSFAGSGTTGHAVLAQNKADGGTRRFITVEMDQGICRDLTAQRIRKAIEGYGDTPGLAGGFRYCTLAQPLFDEHGNICKEVTFADLAAHVYFTETGEPIPKRAGKTPMLGVHQGRAIYLLFNGVLGDKRPQGGNVLTHSIAQALPAHPEGKGVRVVYGEACRLAATSLKQYGITFRQIPFELKVD